MAEQVNAQEQNSNQLLKVRREKLAALQEAGKDPFQITKYDQTHHTEDARKEYETLEAKLLADRAPVNTEGMEEEAAKEAGIFPSTFYRRARETKMSTF